jgi:hypothetical protein
MEERGERNGFFFFFFLNFFYEREMKKVKGKEKEKRKKKLHEGQKVHCIIGNFTILSACAHIYIFFQYYPLVPN